MHLCYTDASTHPTTNYLYSTNLDFTATAEIVFLWLLMITPSKSTNLSAHAALTIPGMAIQLNAFADSSKTKSKYSERLSSCHQPFSRFFEESVLGRIL